MKSFFKWMAVAGLLLELPMIGGAAASVSYFDTEGTRSFTSNTVSGSVDLPANVYLGASYNSYHSDNSSGTITTYGGRLGQYTANGSWRLSGSVTPEVSQFQAVTAGIDFTTAIWGRNQPYDELPLPVTAGGEPVVERPRSNARPRLDFIGGYERAMYKDQGQNINENDITGGLGLNLYRTYVSATFTKSIYDEEINGTFNSDAHRFNIGLLPAILPGYPDYSYTAGIDQTLFLGWWVYGSYTHLKFKNGPDDLADLISVGTGLTLFRYFFVTLAYTYYDPTQDIKQHFVSLGGGVRF